MLWKLRTNDFKESEVRAVIKACDKTKMIFLGLKKLSLFWALALFSVMIPLLHFVLVPAFLVVGIVAFLGQYKNEFYTKAANCLCPQCLNQFSLESLYFFDGKKLRCQLCMAQLTILVDGTVSIFKLR